jgi:hypothetical protein
VLKRAWLHWSAGEYAGLLTGVTWWRHCSHDLGQPKTEQKIYEPEVVAGIAEVSVAGVNGSVVKIVSAHSMFGPGVPDDGSTAVLH